MAWRFDPLRRPYPELMLCHHAHDQEEVRWATTCTSPRAGVGGTSDPTARRWCRGTTQLGNSVASREKQRVASVIVVVTPDQSVTW